jgi:hypothetical protein
MDGQAVTEDTPLSLETEERPDANPSSVSAALGILFVFGVLALGVVAVLGSTIGIEPWTGVVTFLGAILAAAVLIGLTRVK